MREILFRGKRIDNGEWVEGAYYAEPYTDKAFVIRWNSTGMGFNEFIEVAKDTIGQYTGLKDANGKFIFDGDIVNQWDWNAVVEYGVFNCSCCDGVYGWYFNDADIRSASSCTVIGNIHDNPELLEEVNHA